MSMHIHEPEPLQARLGAACQVTASRFHLAYAIAGRPKTKKTINTACSIAKGIKMK